MTPFELELKLKDGSEVTVKVTHWRKGDNPNRITNPNDPDPPEPHEVEFLVVKAIIYDDELDLNIDLWGAEINYFTKDHYSEIEQLIIEEMK